MPEKDKTHGNSNWLKDFQVHHALTIQRAKVPYLPGVKDVSRGERGITENKFHVGSKSPFEKVKQRMKIPDLNSTQRTGPHTKNLSPSN